MNNSEIIDHLKEAMTIIEAYRRTALSMSKLHDIDSDEMVQIIDKWLNDNDKFIEELSGMRIIQA